MQDISNILELKKQQAETRLANLVRRRDRLHINISDIEKAIAIHHTHGYNLVALEAWRQNQKDKIAQIKSDLAQLETEIETSKANYRIALGKFLAARRQLAENNKNRRAQLQDREDNNAQEMYRLGQK